MSVVFNAPPGWPPPPLGWLPPAGWRPPEAWPEAPAGWTFYLELVPAYRRHPILVHPARGVVDPGYRTARRRLPGQRAWSFLRRYAIVTVPVGVIGGVVVCLALLGLLGGRADTQRIAAMDACSAAVDAEVAQRADVPGAVVVNRVSSRSLTVRDITESGATILTVSGIYRGPSGSWSFACTVSTAAQPPSVGEVNVVPLTN